MSRVENSKEDPSSFWSAWGITLGPSVLSKVVSLEKRVSQGFDMGRRSLLRSKVLGPEEGAGFGGGVIICPQGPFLWHKK